MKAFFFDSKISAYILLIVSFLFMYCVKIYGQGKVNISAGFGVPELYHVGVSRQLDQTQIGFSIGLLPEKKPILSVLGVVYYHFGGTSKLSKRRPWYVRSGLTYLRTEDEYIIDQSGYIGSRIGRNLNISKKFGIDIDAGIMFEVWHKETEKEPRPCSGWFCDWELEMPVYPGIGVRLFYRL